MKSAKLQIGAREERVWCQPTYLRYSTEMRTKEVQLFEEPATPAETVAVRVDQVRLERSRRFGDVWMGLHCGEPCGWTSYARSFCRLGARLCRGR